MSNSLPIRPSQSVHQTLVRAERMLAHATGHSVGGSELDRMIAIHGLDNACEFLLRIIGDHLDLESKTGKNWDFVDLSSLAGETSKALTQIYNYRLSHLSDLKVLRQMRNLVQHGAIDPQGDIQRFVGIVQRFFQGVLQDVFGLERGEVAASVLIDNAEVKAHLSDAEKYLDERNYLEVVIAARDAFENAYYRKLTNSDITLSLLPAIVQAKSNEEQYPWSMVTIKNELELTRLGINSEETRRFFEYLEYIPFARKHTGYSKELQREWNVDDALFCYSFASSTALKWQEAEKKPINVNNWDPAKYHRMEKLSDIDLTNTFEGGCAYYDNPNKFMQLWYLDKARKVDIEKLEVGGEYVLEWANYEYGKLEREGKSIYLLKGVYTELTTNNPERWKVIIWYERKHFN
jgi:hypothetical protein